LKCLDLCNREVIQKAVEKYTVVTNFVGSDVGDGFDFGAGRQQHGEVGEVDPVLVAISRTQRLGLRPWQVSQSQPMYRTATKPLLTVFLA
jgi:hypothetical protein